MLEAFAAGIPGGAQILPTSVWHLSPGSAAFYGMRMAFRHLWDQALVENRTWFYIDNAWFDVGRENYYRIGLNALQSFSQRESDGRRLREQGVIVRDWKTDGRQIVVCRQSDEFMRLQADWTNGAIGWQQDVLEVLREHTDRPIKVRIKGADRPLAEDLKTAFALVTHSSAAAVESLLAGVPVCVTDPECAAARFATPLPEIEAPIFEDGREEWAARLADSQWTLEELRAGLAWTAIHAGD